MWPSPESQTFWLSVIRWHAMSCWFPPPPLSWPVTPELVAEPCDQYSQPSLTRICSVGWSPVGRPVIIGVTDPADTFTLTIRDVLFPPPLTAPRTPWLESLANSLPPARSRSKESPIAGPSAWKPPPPAVGLPIGPPVLLPLLSKTRMPGVNGFAALNLPIPIAFSASVSLLLHLPGSPVPDSST